MLIYLNHCTKRFIASHRAGKLQAGPECRLSGLGPALYLAYGFYDKYRHEGSLKFPSSCGKLGQAESNGSPHLPFSCVSRHDSGKDHILFRKLPKLRRVGFCPFGNSVFDVTNYILEPVAHSRPPDIRRYEPHALNLFPDIVSMFPVFPRVSRTDSLLVKITDVILESLIVMALCQGNGEAVGREEHGSIKQRNRDHVAAADTKIAILLSILCLTGNQ